MEIKSLQVGPIGTNCYLLCDEREKLCAVIDPGGEASRVDAAVKLADKICNLRVFEDENDKMNLNLEQVGGSLLVISQFTLYADTSSRRPGFSGAAKPDLAIPLYEDFMARCRERGFTVEHGEFGAKMEVDSLNHGPVTILFDTDRP